MTSQTCITSIPRGPFNSSASGTTTPHCVYPALDNSTSILTSCLNKQSTNSTPAIVEFTTNTNLSCEYIYVNLTDSYSVTDLMACWVEDNRYVYAGCYGSTAADRNRTVGDKGGSAGRVEGKFGVLMSVALVVGVMVGGGLGGL